MSVGGAILYHYTEHKGGCVIDRSQTIQDSTNSKDIPNLKVGIKIPDTLPGIDPVADGMFITNTFFILVLVSNFSNRIWYNDYNFSF